MSAQPKHFYEFGPFRADPLKRILLRDGALVPLKPKVFEMLLVLVEARGQVLEKDELLRRVWPDSIVEESNLNVYVSLLRKALGESPNDRHYIVTISGGATALWLMCKSSVRGRNPTCSSAPIQSDD